MNIYFDTNLSLYKRFVEKDIYTIDTFPNGFKWDDAVWVPDDFIPGTKLPSYYDAIPKISESFWQKGVLDKRKDCGLISVKKTSPTSHEWNPVTSTGTLYFDSTPMPLFSDNAIHHRITESIDEDTEGMYSVDLVNLPKLETEIIATYYSRDYAGNLSYVNPFKQRTNFSPIIVNHALAVPYSESSGGYVYKRGYGNLINKSKREFRCVINNDYNIFTKLPSYIESSSLIYPLDGYKVLNTPENYCTIMFALPHLVYANLKFSNELLFREEVDTIGELSGSPLSGRYWVGTTTINGETYTAIRLLVLRNEFNYTNLDLGAASYDIDCPASLIFNNNPLYQVGILEDQDYRYLFTSNGETQINYVPIFPVFDESTLTEIDITSFNLFVVDTDDVTTKCTRVSNISDYVDGSLVFELNPQVGRIISKFPAGCKAYCAYYAVPDIIYEKEAKEFFLWTEPDTNLNPIKTSLTSGYLYFSRRENIPSKITLSINQQPYNSTGAYGPVDFYTDDVILIAKVTGVGGIPVANQNVTFYNLDSFGRLSVEESITNHLGYAYTQYFPPRLLNDFGVRLYLYSSSGPNYNGQINFEYLNDYQSIRFESSLLTLLSTNNYSSFYIFGVYSDDDLQPYDADSRTGGRIKLLYKFNGIGNVPVQPTNIAESNGLTTIDFGCELPNNGDSGSNNLEGFWIVTDRLAEFEASTTSVNNLLINSNQINLLCSLHERAKGVYTLPIPSDEIYNGSMLDSATYLCINPNEYNDLICDGE